MTSRAGGIAWYLLSRDRKRSRWYRLAGMVALALLGCVWMALPSWAASNHPDLETMASLQELDRQGQLTVRALGAWGLLSAQHQQLALRLREHGMDLLAADRVRIEQWLTEMESGLHPLSPEDRAILAELLSLLQFDSPDEATFDELELGEPLRFELPDPRFLQPPPQVTLDSPSPDLDPDLCVDIELPDLPVDPDPIPTPDWLTTPLAQRVADMSQRQYAQSVVYTRELLRSFLAPETAAEAEAFDAAWMQLEDFPSQRVVHWLDRLNPLLAEWMALVNAMDTGLAAFEETRFEAEMAAFYEHEEYTRRAMQHMGRIVAHLESLQGRIEQVAEAVEALGKPPDPVIERCLAQEAFRGHLAALDGEFSLEGAYELNVELILRPDNQHPTGVAYEREPQDTRLNSVIKLLRTERDGTALFYRFKELDRRSAPDFGFRVRDEDEWWEVFYADPVPGGWVRYEYDDGDEEYDEPPTLEITWFRTNATEMHEDRFLIEDGQLIDGKRTVHGRKPVGVSAREYVPGESAETVDQTLRDHAEGLRWALESHREGRRLYQQLTEIGFALPALPHPDHLHWVLSDVRMARHMEPERLVSDTHWIEERRRLRDARVSANSVEIEWDTIINEYEIRRTESATPADTPYRQYIPHPDEEGPIGGGMRVLARTSTEPGHARIRWGEPPILLRDGRAWALHPQGSGTWQWSIGGLFNPSEPEVSGMPIPGLAGGPLELLAQDPEEDRPTVTLVPQMAASGGVESREGEGEGGAQRWLHFDSGRITSAQHEHVVPVVIGSPGGTVKIDLVYSLQVLDERQQALYARMTLDDLIGDDFMLAEADTSPTSSLPPILDEHELLARKIAFHEENIQLLEADLQRYQEQLSQAGDAAGQRLMAELVLGKQADLQAQQDAVTSLITGQFTRTRTGWDDMVLMQAEEHSRQMAVEIAAELRSYQALERAMDLIPTHAYAETRAWVLAELGEEYDKNQMRTAVQHVLQRGMALNRIDAMEHLHGDEAEANQLTLDILETTRYTSETFMGYAVYVMPLITGGGALAIGYGLTSGAVHGYQTGGRLGPESAGGVGMALTAVETAARFYSPSINYAVTFHDGYQEGGMSSAVSQVAISFVQRKALQFATQKAIGFKRHWETRDARAAAQKAAWKNNLRQQRHVQEKAYGKALVEHHQDTYRAYRAASRNGAPQAQLAALDTQLMDLTAAIKHSPHAKGYLKFDAPRDMQAAYNATDRLHTQRIVREFRAELNRAGFDTDQLTMRPIRNAGNITPGMDLDLNVISRDGRIVRYRDPATGMTRNMDLYSANKLWQQAFNKVYAKNAGGRSARQSWQAITSDAHLEAYHTEAGRMSPWIRISQIRGCGDVLGASRSALDLMDPRYASDAARITEFKAHEMRHMQGMGRDTQNWEIFRGTAKDIRTKAQPLMVDRLRKQLTPQQRAKTQATYDFYDRLAKAMDLANTDPVAAEREVRLLTGHHPLQAVHMTTMAIESLGLFR